MRSIVRDPQVPRHLFSGEGGFSLIEVMAALFIFTLLTLGLVPLLTSSIRGSNTARADTIGKNAALKAMERVRGLPFYVSYATSTTKVDVLDLYYPDGATDVVDTNGRTIYRVVCPWNDLSDLACPRDVATGYTMTFEAQFVDAVASGTQPTPGETATSYANVAPAVSYAWNSASTDTPPRQIVQMTVIATWTVGNSSESYALTSLLSDRNFGGRKVKGTATLGYGVDVYTAFEIDGDEEGNDNRGGGQGGGGQGRGNAPDGTTEASNAETTFVATSESDVEGRRVSTARQITSAGRAELRDDVTGSLGLLEGATSSTLVAPPDQAPGDITALGGTLEHPDFDELITGFGPTLVSDPAATAATALPVASGDSSITGAAPGATEYVFKKDPQLTNGDYNMLQLATAGATDPSILGLVRDNGLPVPLPIVTAPVTTGETVVGGTLAQTLADSVHTQATTGFDRMFFLKSNWIPDTAPIAGGGTLNGQGHIVVVDDFQAAAVCDSDRDGTGDGEAQYRATLYYWEDPVQNGDRGDGFYRRVVFDVTTANTGTDPLAAVKAQNSNNGPLVYDHPSANQQIYLFGTTSGKTVGDGTTRAAYLRDWNSVTTAASRVDASTDAAGAAVSAVSSSIDGAIQIETADLDTSTDAESLITVSLGSVSCLAEDAR